MNDKKKLIILDEPFENLDKESKLNFMDQLKRIKEKTTIIIISHDEKDLKICDRIFNLENKNYNHVNPDFLINLLVFFLSYNIYFQISF